MIRRNDDFLSTNVIHEESGDFSSRMAQPPLGHVLEVLSQNSHDQHVT